MPGQVSGGQEGPKWVQVSKPPGLPQRKPGLSVSLSPVAHSSRTCATIFISSSPAVSPPIPAVISLPFPALFSSPSSSRRHPEPQGGRGTFSFTVFFVCHVRMHAYLETLAWRHSKRLFRRPCN